MTRRPRLAAASGLLLLTTLGGPAVAADAPPQKRSRAIEQTPAPMAATTRARTTPTRTAPNPALPARTAADAGEPTDGTSEADLLVTIRLEEIRQQRDAFEAGRLVDQAVREELRGRDEEAEALYARAVELDPDNGTARLGLSATRDRLGLEVDRASLIERAERESRARRQEVMYRFDAAVAAAADGIAAGTPEGFGKARLQIDRARLARAASPEVFSPADLEELDARIAEYDLALEAAIQTRADAIRRARRKETLRDIKAARVKDIRLEL